jgi:hypothetical protein
MAYTRLFSPLRGVRDWGHGFWVHRVDKFGRQSEARGGTMSGGKKKDGTGSREVVPGWSMLRCSAGRELTLTGDAFSARKSILRGGESEDLRVP